MTQKADIHASREDELPAIAVLERDCFSVPWTPPQIAESRLADTVVMKTASIDGIAVGYLCATYIFGEAEIQRIAVSPAFRRQGHARALLQAFFEEYAPDETFLDVRASNIPAQELYKSEGFEVCGVRKKYYDSPAEDAVLMRRERT